MALMVIPSRATPAAISRARRRPAGCQHDRVVGEDPEDRGDVDDSAKACATHLGDRELREKEGRIEIDRQVVAPRLSGKLGERVSRPATGIVDEPVKATESVNAGAHQGPALRGT